MGNNILDEIETGNYPKYGLKSFKYFLYAIIVVLIFVGDIIFLGSSLFGFTGGISFLVLPTLLILSAFISSILGLVNVKKSIQNKERTHWKKTMGSIGNPILFLLFLLGFFILFKFLS
ncbi:MAG: hypothetical protein AB8H03_21435 [Saprospiraceae bacterium]